MRFSIRDVLWLMVVVGLALGWWMDHRRAETTIRYLRYPWMVRNSDPAGMPKRATPTHP